MLNAFGQKRLAQGIASATLSYSAVDSVLCELAPCTNFALPVRPKPKQDSVSYYPFLLSV